MSPAPPIPAVGAVYQDPCYGTWILRLTDERDGATAGTNYSYWPSFNANSTRLLVLVSQKVQTWTEPAFLMVDWDAGAFQVKARTMLHLADTSHLDLTNAIWSGTDPDVLYMLSGSALHSYNTRTAAAALVHDFAAELPGEYGWQMHRSLDDNVFSFTRRRSSDYATLGYAVWQRNANALLAKVDAPALDEVQLDKSGRYLIIKGAVPRAAVEVATEVESQVLDLVTGQLTNWLDGAPDYSFGHSDNGDAIQVGETNRKPGVFRRDLREPDAAPLCLAPYAGGGHYSMLADGDQWVVCSQYVGYATDPPTAPLQGEIFALATDGSGAVRHICRHESYYRAYCDSPRATVSRCGRFVVFSSNWGGRGRTDAFIARARP